MKPLLRNSVAAFFLLLAATLFFLPAIFGNRIFLYRDLFFFHYPLQHYWVSLLSSGQPPYLNTAINGGQPLLANPNYAIFYPGNFLFFVFSFDTAWNLTFVGHVFWAGLGLYCLCRKIGCSIPAALTGAVTFAFGGPLLSSITYHNLSIAASWIPWIVVLASEASRKGGRWLVFASLAWSAQLLAGEPTIQLITVLLLLVGAIHGYSGSETRRAFVWHITALTALAFSVAAIQIMPTLAWLPHTSRGTGLDFRLSAAYWSLHPARLIEFLAPHFYGNVMGNYVQDFWGGSYSDGGYPYILKIYFGWLPLLLSSLVWRESRGRLGIVISLLGLLLSLGHWLPGYKFLFLTLPPFRMVRYPEKFLILAQFGCATTAAIGLNHLMQHSEKNCWSRLRNSFIAAAILLLMVAAAWLYQRPASLIPVQKAAQNRALLQALISCIVALGTIYLSARTRVGHWLLPVILLIDLATYTWELPETQPRSVEQRSPILLKQISQIRDVAIFHRGEDESDLYFTGDTDPLLLMKEALHPLIALPWGIQYGATSDIDRMGWRLSSAREAWLHQNFAAPNAMTLMRESGIGRVISLSPLNRSDLIPEATVRFNEKRVYVYRLSPPPLPFVRWQEGQGSLQWRGEYSHHIQILVEASRAGRLIIARNALPGWRCAEKHESIAVTQSKDGWMIVPVPVGKHQIDLIYTPPGLRPGLLLTAAGTIVLLGLVFFA